MADGVFENGLQHLFDFFRRIAVRAREHGQQTIESYILALSTLDAMCFAKTGKDASFEVFSEFVFQYSSRANVYSKVAVPILFEELKLTKPHTYGALLDCIRQEYALNEHFKNRKIRGIQDDPEWATFWENITARCGVIPPNAQQEFRRFMYAPLLWRHYRTYAVHRLNVRDEAANITGNLEPYYMNEQANYSRFDCGEIGFSCCIKPLMLYGGLRHLSPEIIVDEVARALGNTELGAPAGLTLDALPTWDETFNWWQGNLLLGHVRYRWTLSDEVEMSWVNFGIPLPFILDTLDRCIANFEADCRASAESAIRVWLNYNRRLS